jgi:hypothetical protein
LCPFVVYRKKNQIKNNYNVNFLLQMQNELTDEEAIKIRFDKEIDVNYKELDVDLTSDEEDSRNPA